MVLSKGFRPLVAFSSLVSLAVAAFPEVSGDRCDCYLTNGSSSHYFKTHKFFDFRDRSDYVKVPALIDDPDDSGQASATNDYFLSNDWTDNWTLQGWNNTASLNSPESDASVLMVHSPNNVYFEKNEDQNPGSSTFLNLRTARLKDFQSSSEFESVIGNYHFLSVRMYARTIGAPGAVTAMFTYKDISNSIELAAVQESDFEIRTLDPPDRVHFTNQPSYSSMGLDVQEATRNVTIPNKRDWTDWAVYRMDWSPDNTTWYINGDEVASISFQTPRDPSILIFNSWSEYVISEVVLPPTRVYGASPAWGPQTRDSESCRNFHGTWYNKKPDLLTFHSGGSWTGNMSVGPRPISKSSGSKSSITRPSRRRRK